MSYTVDAQWRHPVSDHRAKQEAAGWPVPNQWDCNGRIRGKCPEKDGHGPLALPERDDEFQWAILGAVKNPSMHDAIQADDWCIWEGYIKRTSNHYCQKLYPVWTWTG